MTFWHCQCATVPTVYFGAQESFYIHVSAIITAKEFGRVDNQFHSSQLRRNLYHIS